MATIGYMKIEGSTQGDITGDATTADSVGNIWQEGHEGETLIFAFRSSAIVPTNPTTGAVQGQRMHQPTSFTKPVDKSSPLLWQALATGETLKIELKLFRTSTAGQQEHYYTIKWEDAVLVEGATIIPDTADAANDGRGHLEEFKFGARKIEWTHEKAGTSASDDWRKPVAA